MSQLTIQQAFDLAVQHHQSGRLHEAEQLYRQILAQQPEHAGALHYLGLIAHLAGRNDIAVDLIRRAIAIMPNYAEAHGNLGEILRKQGQVDQAIAACRQAILLNPIYAEGHCNLGNALRDGGKLEESVAACRRAIALKPDFPEAHYNLGNALKDKGQLDEAIAAYRQAIALRPDLAEGHNNLGNALMDKGNLEEAIAEYRRAIALRPHLAEAHNNLGNALRDKGNLEEAIAEYRQAIALRPDFAEAHNNLGNALRDKGNLEEAIAALRHAIALRPDLPDAHNNLGNALSSVGRLDEAIAVFRQAIAIDPEIAWIDSNLVYTLHFHPDYGAEAIAEEHRRWNRRHAEPLAKFVQDHSIDRGPDRRLRVGYVSPDFRDHSAASFLLPLLLSHDHGRFEIHCFASVPKPDDMTRRLSALADVWHSTAALTDKALAQLVRNQRIDILVDLTLHMARNRLLAFARKPAPLQVTWLGYPGSTGLTAIDYRLTDPYLDPPGMDESVYSEKTIRLPDTFWCYDPLDGRDTPVSSLPAVETGVITFGCLNNFNKINDGVVSLWSQVLQQVKNSRLLVLSPQGGHRQRMLERLSHQGIDPGRVEFVANQPRRAYLELYHRLDVCLDPFPVNGHTTSLDAFWMGVPVVTLTGAMAIGRGGVSLLSNLGLPDLIATDPEQYVRIAASLAGDVKRLSELRSSLRRRMEQSPLMDAPKFARNLEAAYRRMWRTWCQAASPARSTD